MSKIKNTNAVFGHTGLVIARFPPLGYCPFFVCVFSFFFSSSSSSSSFLSLLFFWLLVLVAVVVGVDFQLR